MRLLFIQLALGLFQLDHTVKQAVEDSPDMDREYTLGKSPVHIYRLRNYGTAGGKLKGHMPAIIGSSGLLTLGSAAVFFRLLAEKGRILQKTGFSLLLGGALSNLYDRCRKGYVVDYIRFSTPWRWLSSLVFNISDFFIFAGAILICLGQTDHTQRRDR